MNKYRDSVDNVIDRLSEIEAGAVQILEVTENKKKILSNNMEEEKKLFAENLLRETEEQLKQLRDKMTHQKEEELAGLKQETESVIQRMQEKYAKEHEKIVGQIIHSITKV